MLSIDQFGHKIDEVQSLLLHASEKPTEEMKKALMGIKGIASTYYEPQLTENPSAMRMRFLGIASNGFLAYPFRNNYVDVTPFLASPEAFELTSIDIKYLELLQAFNHYLKTTFIKNEMISSFTPPTHFNQDGNKRFLTYAEEKKTYSRASNTRHIPVFTSEALLLMVLYKKQLLNDKNIEWNVDVIIDINDIVNPFNAMMADPPSSDETKRRQILFNTGGHFATFDIYLTKNSDGKLKFDVIVIDSTNNPMTDALVNLLKNTSFINQVYQTNANLQADNYSCAMFTFDVTKNLYKEPNLLEQVKKHCDAEGKFDLNVLPARLLKNIQFLSKVESFSEKTQTIPFSKKGESLKDYVARHAGFFSDKEPEKSRNFATIDKYHDQCEIMLKLLEQIPDDDIPKILSGEMPLPTITQTPTRSAGV